MQDVYTHRHVNGETKTQQARDVDEGVHDVSCGGVVMSNSVKSENTNRHHTVDKGKGCGVR